MSARVVLDGFDQFRAALRQLPETLTTDAAGIVSAHATQAERSVTAAYPRGPTGHLRAGVQVQFTRGRVGARAVLRSRAPHAHLVEFGTGSRKTRKGYNRGVMPAAPESERLIPIAIRERRRMYDDLAGMLREHGFEVTL